MNGPAKVEAMSRLWDEAHDALARRDNEAFALAMAKFNEINRESVASPTSAAPQRREA